MSRELMRAATNTPSRKWPWPTAAADPTSTGTTAAGRVGMRAASTHARHGLTAGAGPGPLRCRPARGLASRSSRETGELGEVGFPLVEKRMVPFLRLVGEVVEQGGVAGQLLDAREPVGVRVEGGLQYPDG